jgi:hypothetical protein
MTGSFYTSPFLLTICLIKLIKSLSFHSSVRYFKYIVLVLLFYPLTVLGAQGHITVKGQSITIKEAIMLIEKNSNYVFFYNAADLKNIRLKNINCSY